MYKRLIAKQSSPVIPSAIIACHAEPNHRLSSRVQSSPVIPSEVEGQPPERAIQDNRPDPERSRGVATSGGDCGGLSTSLVTKSIASIAITVAVPRRRSG